MKLIFIFTSGDVRATCMYLVSLPSSNDVIYFPSKNNTRLFFLTSNNDVNYYRSKTNNDTNYDRMHVQSKVYAKRK